MQSSICSLIRVTKVFSMVEIRLKMKLLAIFVLISICYVNSEKVQTWGNVNGFSYSNFNTTRSSFPWTITTCVFDWVNSKFSYSNI